MDKLTAAIKDAFAAISHAVIAIGVVVALLRGATPPPGPVNPPTPDATAPAKAATVAFFRAVGRGYSNAGPDPKQRHARVNAACQAEDEALTKALDNAPDHAAACKAVGDLVTKAFEGP